MKKVIPKLIYDSVSHTDLPVWEILQSNGSKIYYERKNYKGLIPIGIMDSLNVCNTRCNVFDIVQFKKGEKINLIKESIDTPIPSNWYGTNLKYCINNDKTSNKNKRRRIKTKVEE